MVSPRERFRARPGPLRSLFDTNSGVRLIARQYIFNRLTGPPMFCLFMLLIGIGLLSWGIGNSNARHAAFMSMCMEDRKEYECIAMWRTGQPTVVPIYIPQGG